MRCEPRIIGRDSFLLTAGTIAVVVGLLFPLSARILDVLLIFSVSLMTAVLIITFSARGALQVQGFPLLVVLATALRMALGVVCSRLILTQGDAGTIVGLVGAVFVRNNCILAILVFGILALVCFGIICRTVKGISRTASEFTSDILPIKQVGIDSDLNAGIIDKSQAVDLREKITCEVGFFVAMAGTARFIFCAAVIELVIVIVNVMASMVVGAVASTDGGISVRGSHLATLVIGAGMITQISALLTTVASAYLVRKSFVPPVVNDGLAEQEFTERIKVVANEVTASQVTELQYDNTVIPTDNIDVAKCRCIGDDNENDDLSGASNAVRGIWEPSLQLWKDTKDTDYYEAIAALIEGKSGNEAKTILMASESFEELGVTIPVNVAMRLAQREKKCLLIDLDLERSAISKVFDVDTRGLSGDEMQAKAIATCINNLWMYPASYFDKDDAIDIEEVIASLESQYDCLIVYAPNIKLLADSNRIAGCVQAAILFGDTRVQKRVFWGAGLEGGFESSAISDFCKLLISSGCAIFEPAEVFAEAV